MDYTLIFDVVVAGLLIVTIVYAVILNRKLTALRTAKGEMERVLAGFSQATVQAERGMSAMRDAADVTAGELRKQIESGRGLLSDLGFLVERANALADRLDGAIGNRRPAAGHKPAQPAGSRIAEDSGTGATKAAGIATAAIAPDGEPEPGRADPISPKQAALLKALRAIR